MNYNCFKFKQRNSPDAPYLCMFEAPVSDVIAWSTIPRLTPDNQDGIQRARKDSKVKAIKNFFTNDSRNTIPTAVVITMSEGSYSISENAGQKILTINPQNKEGIFVVDGQHRIYGLHAYDENSRIPVVAILNANSEERAFQFIVINNKVSKVPADHIRALTLKYTGNPDEADLAQRLKMAKLSLSQTLNYVGFANDLPDSPFYGLVSMPHVAEDNRRVVPAAIEASIAYIQSKNIRELSGDDSAYDFFITIWSTIKDTWPNTFAQSAKLLSKVGLVSMTQFITDTINTISSYPGSSVDIADSESLCIAIKKILTTQSEDFWMWDWDLAISDTRSVREAIQNALENIHQNNRYKENWFNQIDFITPPN
ncbi:DGQHR domain-containing protein [Silvimonas iriomotensis]|uniref:DGQHR domain-containing protein n=1 Tax=Silvimonas iriomotensis TaxID=449662 RepID=A0ABQ2PE06_9NEIS|nr:DGQHR domain-containing protein [Silvimonas iriomotensis]GGP23788.1 hypothetical protein GCM10010970_37880 [Silvimonas iriomotensis]